MVVIFAALLVVGYFLHRHVQDDSAFARYLHTDFGTPPELNWWAESGVSSWIWILIGVIGATIASMHALMNFEFTLMVWKAIRDQNLEFNFVPAWISDCHGWEAIRTIWYCVIAGSVVFLTSFAAVSYLVIGGTKSQEFLAFVTIVLLTSGVTLNAAMIGLIYRSVRHWFMNACDRYTSSLRTAIVAANSSTDIRHLLTRVALRLETHDLSGVRNFPFSSRWQLIPAGVAFVITNFAVIGALISWAAR